LKLKLRQDLWNLASVFNGMTTLRGWRLIVHHLLGARPSDDTSQLDGRGLARLLYRDAPEQKFSSQQRLVDTINSAKKANPPAIKNRMAPEMKLLLTHVKEICKPVAVYCLPVGDQTKSVTPLNIQLRRQLGSALNRFSNITNCLLTAPAARSNQAMATCST